MTFQSTWNRVAWPLSFVLLCVAFVLHATWSSSPWFWRAGLWTFTLPLLLFFIYRTARGQAVLHFVMQSRAELDKVTWPERSATTRMTVVVLIFVAVMGFLLWLIDNALWAAVRWLAGGGG